MWAIAQRAAAAFDRAGVPAGARVLVACSGGPDSTALAAACARLSDRGRLGPVALAHVDHGLRPGGDRERARVAALAARLGAGAMSESVEVRTAGGSLEDAARRARYAALRRMADAWGADVIATGHTASDQAETVLMRLLRGAGIPGLAGIPLRRGRIVRPLLDVTRAEVERGLAEAGFADVLRDPMNADPRFLRARVRHRWLPALREENPALDAALAAVARAAAEQRDVLDWAARRLPLEAAAVAAAPPAVGKRALQLAAEAAGARRLGRAHIEALWRLARRPDAGTASLALPGVRAVREYGALRFEPAGAAEARAAAALAVEGPDGPYAVRRWRPGDRMRPARLRGRSRKLSDLFIDAKVPRRLRADARVAVRASDGAIVWAEHIGPAWGARVRVAERGSDAGADPRGPADGGGRR